jgi:transketolase
LSVSSTSTSHNRCLRYRRRILEISQKVTAHVAPALSCVEICDVIYNELMRPQDVFVLSKGHGCLAQYVILEERGLLNLHEFCAGSLGGHPDRGGPIAASTGSLGHGLGMAVGMAYAEKLKGSDVRVYVVCSDGELQAGSTWEAVRMAAELKLDNLALFVDANGWGGMDRITSVGISPKFWAFGWGATNTGGHDGLRMRLRLEVRDVTKPFALVCDTVKGKGVSYMEESFELGDGIWHYRSPSKEECAQAMEELNA